MKEEVVIDSLDLYKSVSKFIHHGNNCLTAILGNVELAMILLQMKAGEEEVITYIRKVMIEAKELVDLMQELDEQR